LQENEIAEIFKVLSHSSRIKILRVLEKDEGCVRDLEQCVRIKQSNLSQHLRILKDKGIVECERNGMEVCYRIKDKKIMTIIKYVEKFLTSGRGSS